MLKAAAVLMVSGALLLGLLAACAVPPPVVAVPGSPGEPTPTVPLPQVVDQLGGESLALAVDGNTVYLGVGPRVLAVDVSDPTSPQMLGQSPVLPGVVHGIDLAGGYAMIAAGAGLHLLDVRAPAQLQVAGTLPLEGEAQQVSAGPQTAVAVAGACQEEACGGSLVVVDPVVPSAPQLVGQLELPDLPVDVEGSAELLVVGHGSGVTTVDASDPAQPQALATTYLPGGVRDVELDGPIAFAAGNGQVHVLDLTYPITPTVAGTYSAVPAASTLALADGLLYVGEAFCEFDLCGSNVLALDRTQPAQLAESGLFSTSGAVTDMHVAGDLAFLATAEEGLQVVDVAEPAKARVLGRLSSHGSALDVAALGESLVVAGGPEAGLQLLDTDQAGLWGVTSRVPGLRWANGMELLQDMGYAPAWEDGLQVIDFNETLTPTVTGVITPAVLGGAAYAVALEPASEGRPDTAFVALGGGGLATVDVSAPEAPSVTGRLEEAGEVWAIAAADPVGAGEAGRPRVVYVAGGISIEDQRQGFLHSVDVEDLTAPATLARIDLPTEAWDVAAGPEGMVYVASGSCSDAVCQGQLTAVEVSDPAQPLVVEVLGLPWAPMSITLDSERAYLAAGGAGVGVVSLADPRQPVLLGTVDTPGSARRVQLRGAQLVVADGAGGLVFLEE